MKNKIGIIFPYAESYDSHFGGAIARWVFKVNREMAMSASDISVYSASRKNNYGNVTSSAYGFFCDLIKCAERKYASTKLLNTLFYQLKRFTCRDSFWLLSIYNKIKKNDLIIIHNRPKWVLLLRQLGYKGQVILHMHNSHIINSKRNEIKKVSEYVHAVVFCSKFLLDEAVCFESNLKNKSYVVYNGIDDCYEPTSDKPLLRKKNILFAGRLIDDKGVVELVEGFDLFSKYNDSYTLDIIGGVGSGESNQITPYLDKLIKTIETSKSCSRIRFLGYLDHDELMVKMRSSEILAVPSKWKEPFGMVALEGFYNGCKVLATENGGMKEILKDQGFYCSCDPKSICDAMMNAVESKTYYPKIDSSFYWNNISSKYASVIDKL
ncbi:glycosyltransferase family 4 protein [Vibrio alginolyticus]|uniref:glycosyltransferase family 4 protein n=1 Tax=Vibrio alginolyticus TaxID=663 RepID=UPI002160F257|nr:glycosyltransferase family 4 protein [Vibrio alginolyticus]MCS0164747.1 glycosyltransferase family 4 protein [Vibrio alginolyticus]